VRDHASKSRVRIGPAGWAYADWSGYVYPSPRPRNFHELSYLAQFFDTVEINASFYAPIRPDHAALWISRVAANPRFVFTAKMWQRFTHDPGTASAQEEREVRAGFGVLQQAGKLGAVLLQFPFSFHRSAETHQQLASLLKRFAEYPLAVEVRHATWLVPEFFGLLRSANAAFCNIDQPLIGRSIEPSAFATASIAYVRLHGRRYDTWFSDDPDLPPHERYNYLYSPQELAPWGERIRKVSQTARDTYVVTNNHYLGKNVVNALELISLLKGEKIEVPESLRPHYPRLEAIASSPRSAPTLFD
jgi:uncharacterized protein YecE (DUF72 family)